MIPKPTTHRDEKYKAFVRREECAVCPRDSQHHHLETGGMGMKGDDRLASNLCAIHHRELHDKGRKWFEREYKINLYRNGFRMYLRYQDQQETA